MSGLAVYKEYGLDSNADLLDIAFTIVGGAIVWVTWIVGVFLA